MLIVGIDPHKSTHTAAALDTITGQALGECTITATAEGYRELSAWCHELGADLISVENLRGLGCHLGAWLHAQGFDLVDVSAKEVRAQRLARRGGRNKNDPADAFAAALAAAHGGGYRRSGDEHGQIASLLTEEREALNAEYVAKRNRLHAHLRALRPGGAPTGSSLEEFSSLLKGIKADRLAITERKRQARALLAELRGLKRELAANETRMRELIGTAGSSLPDIPGFGTVTTTAIMGAVGSIDRFADQNRLAAFAGAAPKQIASAASDRHRLDRRGNYQIKRSIHTAAMTQARMKHGPGRAYYLRKREEGKTHREALRCLKRQLIKIIWRTMKRDADHRHQVALAA